jgi:hypothetical protein
LVILISRIFIEEILGSEWLLSIPIYISFALYEIVRGFFHVRYNSCLAKLSTPSSWTLINLFFICLVLAFILSNVMGLIGIPLAFGIGYLGAYTALRIEKRI